MSLAISPPTPSPNVESYKISCFSAGGLLNTGLSPHRGFQRLYGIVSYLWFVTSSHIYIYIYIYIVPKLRKKYFSHRPHSTPISLLYTCSAPAFCCGRLRAHTDHVHGLHVQASRPPPLLLSGQGRKEKAASTRIVHSRAWCKTIRAKHAALSGTCPGKRATCNGL